MPLCFMEERDSIQGMTDNELLLAISNMLEPVRNDIKEIKGKSNTGK